MRLRNRIYIPRRIEFNERDVMLLDPSGEIGFGENGNHGNGRLPAIAGLFDQIFGDCFLFGFVEKEKLVY